MSLAAALKTQDCVDQPGTLTLDDVIAEIAQRHEEFERLAHVPRDVIEKLKRSASIAPQRRSASAAMHARPANSSK